MTDTTAKIRAKGLDATGVTEDIANEMYAHKGKHYMAIVEVKVDETHEKAEGKRKVDLIIEQVEPAMDPTLDDHLRNLTRTMHQNRVLKSADDQLQIETLDDLEPTVEQVIAAGQAHIAQTDDELPDPEDQGDPNVDPGESHGLADLDDDPCPAPGCTLVAEHDGDHDHDPKLVSVPSPFATSTNGDPAA